MRYERSRNLVPTARRQHGAILLEVTPQILNRIKVRRIGGQLMNGQTVGLGSKKRLYGFAGVILGPILNEDHMLFGFGQDLAQEGLIAFRVELAGMLFIYVTTRLRSSSGRMITIGGIQ